LRSLGFMTALATLSGGAAPETPTPALGHTGPVGLAAGQSAVVTVANPTGDPLTTVVTLLDESARVLVRRRLSVSPGGAGAVRLEVGSAARVRATVAGPGGEPSRYPIALWLYDAGSESPALATSSTPARTRATTAVGPFCPMLAAARNVVGVVNLGPLLATFRVSFVDGKGGLVATHDLVVAPEHTGVAEAAGPAATGVRAEVQAPPDTPYLVTTEVVDDASGRTLAVLPAR
jgi:hypothetical protein